MFTGIVESTGTIAETRQVAGGRRLRVHVGAMAQECKPGDSVCVCGVCLTVTSLTDETLDFDVITETLAKTTLGQKRPGDRVNLERSLKVGDRLDGHMVQGHVDGLAVVREIRSSAREWVVRLRPDPDLLPYLIPKGSVAVDGVSLTIVDVNEDSLSVALIPTTLQRTTLATLKKGDRVNIESDIIARTIVHHLGRLAGGGLSLSTLQQAGFA